MTNELRYFNPKTGREEEVTPTKKYEAMEACRILGISKSTLQRAARTGRIRYHLRADNSKRFYMGKDISKFFYSER